MERTILFITLLCNVSFTQVTGAYNDIIATLDLFHNHSYTVLKLGPPDSISTVYITGDNTDTSGAIYTYHYPDVDLIVEENTREKIRFIHTLIFPFEIAGEFIDIDFSFENILNTVGEPAIIDSKGFEYRDNAGCAVRFNFGVRQVILHCSNS